MSYTVEDCKRDTIEHINQVRRQLSRVIVELEERGRVHDKSKLESPELEIFTEYTPKLADSTYGSDEYNENLKGMRKALEHHYENNRHHPEYFKKYVCNGCHKEYKENPKPCHSCYTCGYSQFQVEPDITQMNLLDIIEMFCDWKAATLRHNGGDLNKSIEINQKRFNYSDDLKEIFKNSVSLFD